MRQAISSRCRRHGYSLTVVLLFLVLLLFLWAAVYRTTASFLRVETAQVNRNNLDSGMLGALAQALLFLEKNPTLSRNAVIYGIPVPVNPNNPNNPNSPQVTNFTATFTPSTTPANGWTIVVAPGTCVTPLPSS